MCLNCQGGFGQCGDRLICVQRRYYEARQRRLKTVELIVEEAPWSPPVRTQDETLVGVRVAFREVELQRQVRQADGKWNPEQCVWEMRHDKAVALGLENRIEKMKVSTIRHQ